MVVAVYRGSRSRRATIDHLLRHGNVYRVGREDYGTLIRVYDTRTLYSHARVSCIRRAYIYIAAAAVVRTVLTRQRPDDDLLSLVKPLRCSSFYYYYYFPSLLLYFSYLHSLSSPLPVTSFIVIQRFPTSDPLCVCVRVREYVYLTVSLSPQNIPKTSFIPLWRIHAHLQCTYM